MKIKTLLCSAFIIFFLFNVKAQVFNTATTLKKGTFSAGINPVISGNDLGLYIRGGYGLASGLDLAVKAGLGLGGTYIGADIEYMIHGKKPYVSLSAGGHMQGNLGFDGTLNISMPIVKNVSLFGGLDADLNFGSNINMPVWIPVGLSVGIYKNLSLILEGDIAVFDAGSIFGGGLSIYF